MITRIVFIVVDVLAIFDILLIHRSIIRMKEDFAAKLSWAMKCSVLAILANIMIAASFDTLFAEISYTLYFASINWIILFLTGFCLLYTEHGGLMKKLTVPAIAVMAADTVSLFLNLVFHHVFVTREVTDAAGTVFYHTDFEVPYYIHLAIDYLFLVVVLASFVIRISKVYSMYRVKYAMILGVLLFVILMNVVYMAFGLNFDGSVVFYAVAGTLITFSITIFVPRTLMRASIGRAIDDMNEGLILFDLSRNCIYANEYAKKRFDIDEKEYGFENEPVATVTSKLGESGAFYGEQVFVRKAPEGELEEHYKIRYNRLADKAGHTIGSYFLIEDITEQIDSLAKINEAKNEADAANTAKSVFLANMSHEIRTPLNSIIGMNEMILRSTDDPKLIEYASDIRTSGDALLSLINDILDFSKIEAGRMEINPSEYDSTELIRSCCINFRQMTEEKGIYYNISCDEDVPRRLYGDAKLIRQIVSNIISNAVKYTKKGGIDIRIRARKMSLVKVADPAGGEKTAKPMLFPDREGDVCELIFEVEDTGIGIAKEDIGVLFDSFRRLNENENATIQGTGLGLAITKELVDLMNGDIQVESTRGKGTVFTVSVPQIIAAADPIGQLDINTARPEVKKYRESFTAPDAKILIVDDVKVNIKLMTELLKKTQLNMDTAESGTAAIKLCRENVYDLILLDHRMPQPDGIETFRVISKEGLNTETPVVMLTANALSGVEEEYLGLGFAGYLSKPVRVAELEDMLINLLPEEKVEILG